MIGQSTRQLVNLRKAWNNTPKVHRLAFLVEVLATSAPHYRALHGKPATALPLDVARQMDAATQILRTGKQA